MTDIENDPSSIRPRGRLAPSHFQWGFHLSGNEGWLESFTNHFTSVDVQILPEYEDDRPTVYDFTSPHLNGLTGAQAAMRARELLILFNGVMRVRFGADFYDFTLGEGRDLWTREPAQEDFYRTVPVPMFPDDVEDLRYFRSQRPLDPVSIQLFLARSDRYLRMIYRTLGREGVSFSSLSKVLDTITADFHEKGKKGTRAEVAALGGKTEGDLQNFNYTANNFDVAGEDARHGLKADFKPANKLKALSLEQAGEVMFPIMQGFVTQRVGETFHRKWNAVLIDRADQARPAEEAPEPGRWRGRG
ncbi:hypothetical protein [Massilia sp. H6]|uniref:hypothetical protein n=1 Tax=Massilia sp. H6 TaxID=2970464 RepID=UPI00216882CB|nr:hypothetical protein [Massilia sp. H6]UVW30577.1 hypothetical protein NRS07_19840 [Massilia sp. H6]